MTTVVLLIPGIFGFGAFGSDEEPILEYFAGVRNILEPQLGDWKVLVHEPPPTGSLDERVASLYDAVWRLQHGQRLPHAKEQVTAHRIHLVGHSTGGVDARLLANKDFHWVGGPRDEERAAILASIGTIVTISAPFRGTPVVRHIDALRDPVLTVAHYLTLLGVFRNSHVDGLFLRLLRGAAGGVAGLLGLASLVRTPSRIVAHLGRRAAARPDTGDEEQGHTVAVQIQSFLRKLENDRQLYHDLSVEHMRDVNERLRETSEFPLICSYVTISPRPPCIDIGRDMLGRLVYGILYGRTTQRQLDGAQPGSCDRLIGSPERIAKLMASRVSCDGAVPTRSQTLEDKAQGIVLADHLDVVGSFEGGTGADVMRSGSGFDQKLFEELWCDIAARLKSSPPFKPKRLLSWRLRSVPPRHPWYGARKPVAHGGEHHARSRPSRRTRSPLGRVQRRE